VVLQGGVGGRLECRVLEARHRGREKSDLGLNQLGQVAAHNGTITCVRASRNGGLALTAGEDGVLKLWRVAERPAK
jgi:hypothetical protein